MKRTFLCSFCLCFYVHAHEMLNVCVAVSVRVTEEQRKLLQTPALRLSSAGGERLYDY